MNDKLQQAAAAGDLSRNEGLRREPRWTKKTLRCNRLVSLLNVIRGFMVVGIVGVFSLDA